MKIPITMCHGISQQGDKPLQKDRFNQLMNIVAEMGFQSINYDDLEAWRNGTGKLPTRPIMIDFDHPVKSMRHEVFDALSRHGLKGNLFINTGMMEENPRSPWPKDKHPVMTWEEVRELVSAGWHIGAHTVSHPNLSKLSLEDPSGEKLRAELVQCNDTLEQQLGIRPKDFAFTGTSFSSVAEKEVAKLYRFGRLWIVGSKYQADGKEVRYADLVSVPGPDEPDGGPPIAARYITKDTHPYRLPSMEIQGLIYEPAAFRSYLEAALR